MLAGNWQIMKQARVAAGPDLEQILPAWQQLVGRSLVPAGLNSPELVVPLLKNMEGAELSIVQQGPDLLMALPVQKRKFPRGLLSNWITPLTVIGVPHIDRDIPAAALQAFTASLESPLMLHSVETHGAFWDYLSTRNLHFAVLESWQRAALKLDGSFEPWFEKNFDRKRRKEYKRLQNRLSEQGKFEQISYATGDDAAAWVEDLLALEAAGWKGQRGTALAIEPALKSATHEACASLARAGKLRMWKLALDGRPIAVMHGIVEGDQAWLGKIAYDGEFARFSPGVLLILYATEQLMKEEGLARADSCAIPGHPMIENIWRDRIDMADVIIAPRTISATHFNIIVQLERLRRMTRGLARDSYNFIRGRHRS
jgi:CelD/BcsL family acetyltransferase involved in cellulose biosynthesis